MPQHSLSKWLQTELERLDNGTNAEKKRLRKINNAILKVLADPLNHEFNKSLPGNFKAVDVLQQYRLFFKIEEDHQSGDQVIFFVWVNNEESLHQSGKKTDCYAVFRDLYARDEIEVYEPQPTTSDRYDRCDSWGNSYVYVRYQKTIVTHPPMHQVANSTLSLNWVTDREYIVQSVTVSHENAGLASDLLRELCSDVDASNITLTYELFIGSENAEKSRHLLRKNSFLHDETIDDVEIWIRRPT